MDNEKEIFDSLSAEQIHEIYEGILDFDTAIIAACDCLDSRCCARKI